MHNLHNNSTRIRQEIFQGGCKHLAIIGLVFILFLSPTLSRAQEEEKSYEELLAEYSELDSLLLEEFANDSSSLYELLDSFLNEDYLRSQFTFRAGYTSNITNAGRNFGLDQYGLNGGIAFYHKSGLFADVGGYYNSDQDPKYNTTTTSVGYMGMIGPRWSYFLSYDHYFYAESNQTDLFVDYPLTNSLNGSINFQVKGFSLGTDYSFLFGDEAAHRVRANIGYSFTTKKAWIFDEISINPVASMLLGNSNITSVVFNQEIAMQNSMELIQKIGRRRYLELYYSNPELLRALLSDIQTNNVFGVMNYAAFVPISFRIKYSTLLLNYSLNFPVALPGETGLDTSPNSYFSITLLQGLPIK